jgi:hypothetical protein
MEYVIHREHLAILHRVNNGVWIAGGQDSGGKTIKYSLDGMAISIQHALE